MSSEDYKRQLISALNHHKIYPREYFDRSLETVFGKQIECPIALDITKRVLCLPMSDYMTTEQVERICALINELLSAARHPGEFPVCQACKHQPRAAIQHKSLE